MLLIPRGTLWFCSEDWGYNAPGVILWWADVGEGHWHVARECKHQGQTAETVAKEWHRVNASLGGVKPAAVVADPSMWAKTGHGKGESIAETLIRHRLPMQKADNDRKNGWQRVHELLRLAPDGRPWLTVDDSCTYLRRTIPAQMSDASDPDDVDTHGDDHGVDALRYGAMSRLVTRRAGRGSTRPAPWTMGWVKQITANEERRYGHAR